MLVQTKTLCENKKIMSRAENKSTAYQSIIRRKEM